MIVPAKINRAVAFMGFLIGLTTFASPADAQDSWEAKDSGPQLTVSCNSVDPSLVAPVPTAHRLAAITSLERVPAIALDRGQTARLLDLEDSDKSISATGRIKTVIGKLKEQKRLELEERIGSWSQSDQERLDRLEALEGSPAISKFKPYLVRAIAKNDYGTGFFVTDCEGSLGVMHGSLGSGPPPPTIRFPLVVFLAHAPKSVWAGWGMAQ